MRRLTLAATLLLLTTSNVACSKTSDEARPAPAASGLAVSTLDPANTAWRYRIDTNGTAEIDMPGLNEHIKGGTSAVDGTLDIVPADLAKSRGIVRVDLSTFATRTFSDEDKNATQTKHARTWLEAVVDGKTNENMRYAEFAIRSIDAPSATDLKTVASVKDGNEEVRSVTMTVRGDLLIHGRKLPKEDVVDVLCRYPAAAAPGSKPTRIDVRSKQPMRVILKEYDVAPRDPAGQLLAWTTNLISKVADTADVTVALTARPLP